MRKHTTICQVDASTFHNVSIKSLCLLAFLAAFPLHPIMFLLNLSSGSNDVLDGYCFTSHYVSIKSFGKVL